MSRITFFLVPLFVLGFLLTWLPGCTREAPGSGEDTGVSGRADTPVPPRPRGWRHDGTGHFPNVTPPTRWDVDEEKGILWQVEVGKSQSSPVVAGDQV